MNDHTEPEWECGKACVYDTLLYVSYDLLKCLFSCYGVWGFIFLMVLALWVWRFDFYFMRLCYVLLWDLKRAYIRSGICWRM
jgi:hypothetical protein